MKILIVEDDFVGRRLIHKLVSNYGTCDIAVDGKEALDAYQLSYRNQQPYDAILLDIELPGIDGLDVLKRIRTMERISDTDSTTQTKVIMITAKSDSKSVKSAYQKGGASGYLLKPVTKFQLEAEFRKLGIECNSNN